MTFTPPTSDRLFKAADLRPFPLFDRGAIKTPVAADAETGETSLAEQAIDRGGMHAKMIGQLLNREDIVAMRVIGLRLTS
jgi:hypothetical protein